MAHKLPSALLSIKELLYNLSSYDYCDNCQRKENDTQNNGCSEKCFFNSTACRKYTASVSAGQSTQAAALALQDNANDESDRHNDQGNI